MAFSPSHNFCKKLLFWEMNGVWTQIFQSLKFSKSVWGDWEENFANSWTRIKRVPGHLSTFPSFKVNDQKWRHVKENTF